MKKQVRISGQEKIKSALNDYLKKEISIVLFNGTTYTGTLLSSDESMLRVQNPRRNQVAIEIKQVLEIFIDTDA